MKKNLTVIGNSLGIIIEKPILDLLGINRETQLKMITDGNRLILEPVKEADKIARGWSERGTGTDREGISMPMRVAPAVEYIYNEHLGLIGDPWISVTGRNAGSFVGAVLAVYLFF